MKVALALLACLSLALPALADTDQLVITEIMYNTIGNDVEFFELYNPSLTETVDLTGWWVIDDNLSHTPVALVGSVPPEGVLVVAGTLALFTVQYPFVTNYNANDYEAYWALGNGGDIARVFNAAGDLVDIVAFDDEGGWPTAADGNGPSLELYLSYLYDNNRPEAWATGFDWGTPGEYPAAPVATGESSLSAIKALY